MPGDVSGGAQAETAPAPVFRAPSWLGRRIPQRFGGVRTRLVALSLAVLGAVSFGITLTHNAIVTAWIDQDFRWQAITFGSEISATISNRSELEASVELLDDIRRIMLARPNIVQMDVLQFMPTGTRLVTSSAPAGRLPFNRDESAPIRQGRPVSKLVTAEGGRSWLTMVPIRIDGEVVGALSTRFSLDAADALLKRIRWLGFGLSALSVAVMALLMGLAVTHMVNRPIGVLLAAIDRIKGGAGSVRVAPGGAEEFDALARHFNDMMARIEHFNEEVSQRIAEATCELASRFDEVQRLNELLYRTRNKLSQSERLAVAGQMVAQVAHEVGTPLHSMAGHLELLRAELTKQPDNGAAIHRIDVVDGQLARVNTILRQLLDLVRPDQPPPVAVDIAGLIEESLDLMRPGFSAKGVELRVEIAQHLPPALGRDGQLQQVVLNLLTNAIDATPGGGAVTVCAAHDGAGEIVVEVRDTGIGIPPARREAVFEPFVTTKPSGEGTGLGLFIAAQIVREHGGHIEIGEGAAEGATVGADEGTGGGCAMRVHLPATGRGV